MATTCTELVEVWLRKANTKPYCSCMKFRQLNDVGGYVLAFHLSNYVSNIVEHWSYFAQRTVGIQFVEAVDSISANIAEGFGRWTKKDRVKFYRYSFGSLYESFDWTEKAFKRRFLTAEQYKHIMAELQKLPKELNSLIKYTNTVLAM